MFFISDKTLLIKNSTLNLNQVLMGHFSNSLFLTKRKKNEMIFCLNMCILMGKKLAMFWNSFLSKVQSFGVKMQKSTFLRENGFASSFL